MQLFLIAVPDAPVGLEVITLLCRRRPLTSQTRDTLLSHLSDEAQAKVLKYRLPEDSLRMSRMHQACGNQADLQAP